MARFRSQDLIPTRYSLLSRLKDWADQDSWKEFFDTYWRLIYSLALRSGLTESEAQDVVQETVICVARDLHKFKRDRKLGSFKGWLGNIIRWRIVDQFRRRKSGRPMEAPSHATDLLPARMEEIPDDAGPGLEAIWHEEWRANLFNAAVDHVKRHVKAEHYQIFDLYVNKQWTAAKVARTMQASLGKIYLVKHRISVLIRREIKRLEKKSL